MPGVEYTVSFTAAGDGAKVALSDLKVIQSAADGAASSLSKLGGAPKQAVENLAQTTKTGTLGLKMMGTVVTALGYQNFPQMTAAVIGTKAALDQAKASGAQMTAGFATMATGIAAVGAAIAQATLLFGEWQNKKLTDASAAGLDASTRGITERLLGQVQALREAGDITIETYERLDRMLRRGGAEGNAQVQQFMKSFERGSAQSLIAEQNRGFANTRANLELNNPNFSSNRKMQEVQLQSEYNDQMKLYNILLEDGLITEQERTGLAMEADTKRIQGLVQLRGQLTDIQQLEAAIAQNFASGMSAALVQSFQQGGQALQAFFSQFMQQTAQMIIQLLIIKALKSTSWGSALFPAAEGGMFPRMMAAGGMQGVSSVSSPTYFPRFNVVAGEAGREMLTVLAKPRMMEIGGMQSVVGYAQGNRLAITNADQLAARAGSGSGMVEIRVTLGPELRAEIVNQSVQNAVVTVTQEAQSNTPLRRAIRQGQA